MAKFLSPLFSVAAVLVFVANPWLGCGPKASCRPETWSGTCRLQSVTKVRETALPLPGVVVEAIYQPVNTDGQVALLPDVRREFAALSKHETALLEHVNAHASAVCYVQSPPPGQCNPGAMIVDVPEFDATKVSVAEEDTGPKGCAQIDAASSQDRIQQHQTEADTVTERFQFPESSADLPGDASALADAIASRMKQDTTIQCLGVVGQYVRGENLEIAFARARAVRQLLIDKGIEPERLVAITLDRPVTGASGSLDPSSPTDRRVTLRVLLQFESSTP